MTFAIERDVPIPPRSWHGPPRKYPLYEMEVGDSFLVAVGEKDTPRDVLHNLKSSIRNAVRCRPGWRFTTRTTSDGVRVWRVA